MNATKQPRCKRELYQEIQKLKLKCNFMKVKEVNRTVRFDTREESSSYRCKYGKKEDFDVLKINVSYNGKITEVYEIESKFLPSSDSIHFKASATADGYTITKWTPETIVSNICKK